jgi:SOS-response transcriptional repressor LexA
MQNNKWQEPVKFSLQDGNILNNTVYKNRHFKRYAMILFVTPASEPALSTAPLFTERCPAGFPSPAADYTEDELDLNAYCIRRPTRPTLSGPLATR